MSDLKNNRDKWVAFAVEIQSIAQAGLTYGHDKYDLERYERLREISAEMLACKTDIPLEKGSSAIIRYYCYIPCTSTLLQATACHIFHTLYVLSFLICY